MTGNLRRVKKPQAIAYWLLPELTSHEVFAQTIAGLARQFGVPRFAPHVTVFIAPENSRSPAEVLRELGAVTVDLTIRSIRFSEKFTKTLFVQFERSDPLQEVGDRIWSASGAPERYVIDPHLSLLYAKLSPQTKQELSDQTAFPLREVRLTSMCAIRCASPTTTPKEVEQWKLLAP
jgi:hypothetical protein